MGLFAALKTLSLLGIGQYPRWQSDGRPGKRKEEHCQFPGSPPSVHVSTCKIHRKSASPNSRALPYSLPKRKWPWPWRDLVNESLNPRHYWPSSPRHGPGDRAVLPTRKGKFLTFYRPLARDSSSSCQRFFTRRGESVARSEVPDHRDTIPGLLIVSHANTDKPIPPFLPAIFDSNLQSNRYGRLITPQTGTTAHRAIVRLLSPREAGAIFEQPRGHHWVYRTFPSRMCHPSRGKSDAGCSSLLMKPRSLGSCRPPPYFPPQPVRVTFLFSKAGAPDLQLLPGKSSKPPTISPDCP
ncbi:hypothetical protein BJY00DRAFT_196907 [Aspergillus carlsbadensis]|nr:hypothetical protein BJY00DRAFT_196907 [Aspergillus carlsbadensis]